MKRFSPELDFHLAGLGRYDPRPIHSSGVGKDLYNIHKFRYGTLARGPASRQQSVVLLMTCLVLPALPKKTLFRSFVCF